MTEYWGVCVGGFLPWGGGGLGVRACGPPFPNPTRASLSDPNPQPRPGVPALGPSPALQA